MSLHTAQSLIHYCEGFFQETLAVEVLMLNVSCVQVGVIFEDVGEPRVGLYELFQVGGPQHVEHPLDHQPDCVEEEAVEEEAGYKGEGHLGCSSTFHKKVPKQECAKRILKLIESVSQK